MELNNLLSQPSLSAPLSQWLDYLMSIHPSEIDMGLSRVTEVAKRLGLLTITDGDREQRATVISVGGTNGKGTTCAFIEQILKANGAKVGVYSSPHILRYNERVRIDGIDATDEQLIKAFAAIDNARAEISLSYFEFATLTGLYLFKEAQLDLILLEVGLGGRLDAVNIIDADISVITSIDLDHQEYLGNTREAVGREKAGIFRADGVAIVGEPDMPNSVSEVADALALKIYSSGNDYSYHKINSSSTGGYWQYRGHTLTIDELPLPTLPLQNAATAIAVIEHGWPTMPVATIKQGIAAAKLPGRLEQLSSSPMVLLDVAHNPHAARYLNKQIAQLQRDNNCARVFALCGMLADKACAEVIGELAAVVDHWYFVDLNVPRGEKGSVLASYINSPHQQRSYSNIADAWDILNNALQDDDLLIVFGSFFTVSQFKELKIGW